MIFQSMKMALKSIRSNKLRSFLTMLGIIIGVFALVVLVSMVNGATSSITSSISELGTDKLTVYAFGDKALTIEDMNAIGELDSVYSVAPVTQLSLNATNNKGTNSVQVIGTTPSYPDAQNIKLSRGRFIMKPDIDNSTNVCVINYTMAQNIMGRQDVVGEQINLGGKMFTIVGVLENENTNNNFASIMGMGGQYTAYIPYSTAIRVSSSDIGRSVNNFYVAANPGELSEAETEVREYLDRHYKPARIRIGEVENDDEFEDYFIYNQSMISDAMDQVTGTLSLLLGGIAGISLLVGGIGIMNIMLVSVTERTREIGIRKAIGARPGVIMLQFLIEAITMSIVGCAVGIGLSWIAMMIIDIIGNVSYGLSLPVVIVAVLFSSGVGVLFGLYPARKAARMKPIDALRFN